MRTRIHRPRTTARSAVATVLAASTLLLVGCGSDEPTKTAADQAETSGPSPAPPTTDASPTSPATLPLEGTWQAGPITLEDAESTLRDHGLGRHVPDFRTNAPFSGDTVLTLTIIDGAWDLYGASDGGQPEPIDYDAEYEIDGDTVVFHHSAGSNTYRWSVDDDVLRLEFVRSTLPAYEGVPEEAYQRALYTTRDFTRVS